MSLTGERRYWREGCGMVAGIDEVGRGSLAGPVVAAAVIFPPDCRRILEVNDSKLLTPPERERLNGLIRKQASRIGIGVVRAGTIDRQGITAAVGVAMRKAVRSIGKVDVLVVDGPYSFGLNKLCDRVETVIRGDQLVYSIAAASIVAKVYRDALMTKLAQRYPVYAWETNKGYGTAAHLTGIKTFGMTPYHRATFIHT